jgi:hypothetical protein
MTSVQYPCKYPGCEEERATRSWSCKEHLCKQVWCRLYYTCPHIPGFSYCYYCSDRKVRIQESILDLLEKRLVKFVSKGCALHMITSLVDEIYTIKEQLKTIKRLMEASKQKTMC